MLFHSFNSTAQINQVYYKSMNIFKTFTLKWWQASIFKLALISFGIILGVYFQAFFLQWIVPVTIVCVLCMLYSIGLWWRE